MEQRQIPEYAINIKLPFLLFINTSVEGHLLLLLSDSVVFEGKGDE